MKVSAGPNQDQILTPGWLAKIKLTEEREFDELMDAEAYKVHCEGQ